MAKTCWVLWMQKSLLALSRPEKQKERMQNTEDGRDKNEILHEIQESQA